MKKKIFAHCRNILLIFLIISFICTFLGYFSKANFIFDICSHFRIQYFLFAIFMLLFEILTKKKNKLVFIAIGTIIFLNFFSIIPHIRFYYDNKKDIQSFTIGSFNVYTDNHEYQKVRDELKKSEPEILVIQEINDVWSNELTEIKDSYPYIYEVTEYDNFGIAIYSKIPIKKVRKIIAGKLAIPIISAECEYMGGNFEILAVHTTPPTSQAYYKNTQGMMENLAKYIKNQDKTFILAGDLNTSFYSYNYKNFIKQTKMKDTGNIFTPTWCQNWIFPMRISLDHIFVSKNVKIYKFKTGKSSGSDHFPIYAKISLKN